MVFTPYLSADSCSDFFHLTLEIISLQSIESSAREFLGKDNSTTLAASVVKMNVIFCIILMLNRFRVLIITDIMYPYYRVLSI